MNNKTWTVTLEEDPETGNVILPFPEDFLAENDWRADDVLNFVVNDNGTCIIENMSWKERHKDEVAES